MTPAPICLFVYNRPEHTRHTIEALLRNPESAQSTLYIFADGAKSPAQAAQVAQVQAYIATIEGFGAIHLSISEQNRGLARSVIAGVSQVLRQHEQVIVLEDDIKTAPNFLAFMNQGLAYYALRHEIGSITGFNYALNFPLWQGQVWQSDVFFAPRFSSWGWATWRDRWVGADWEVRDFETLRRDRAAIRHFNQGGTDLFPMLQRQMQGKINSWAIRFSYHLAKQHQLTVFPILNKVENIGFGELSTHTKFQNRFMCALDTGEQRDFQFSDAINTDAGVMRYFQRQHSFYTRLRQRIKHYIGW